MLSKDGVVTILDFGLARDGRPVLDRSPVPWDPQEPYPARFPERCCICPGDFSRRAGYQRLGRFFAGGFPLRAVLGSAPLRRGNAAGRAGGD